MLVPAKPVKPGRSTRARATQATGGMELTTDFDALRDKIKTQAAEDPEATYRVAGFDGELTPDGTTRLKTTCPFHIETKASFKIDLAGSYAGRWRCYGACRDGGDIIDYCARTERVSQGRATMIMAERLGLEVPRREKTKAADGRRNLREQVPSPEIIARLRMNLQAQPERLEFLQERRGLSESIIAEAQLGLWRDRIAIPVFSADRGELFDVRLYLPDAGDEDDKMQGWKIGTGSARLFYPPGWRTPTADESLVIAEGEFDTLLLSDLGFRALSNTNGAGSWGAAVSNNGLADLQGTSVVIVGDNDEAGSKRNAEVSAWAWGQGAEDVRVVAWDVGLAKGYDVTDFLRDHDVTTDREEAAIAFGELLGKSVEVPEHPALFGPFSDFAAIREVVRDTTWLWQDWLPEGCLTVIGGDQESGKSFLGLRLAQSVITGTPWPDGAEGPTETAPVLWIEAEAAHATTTQRAETMGIPLSQLKHLPTALDGWHFDDPEHLAVIKRYARQEKVRLIVVDSLSTAYSGEESSSEIRHALARLEAVARDLNIAIVLIHHIRKPGPLDTREFDIDRLRGSSAIKQLARAVIGIDHPNLAEEKRRVQVAKCNMLAEKPAALGYELVHDCQALFGEAPEAQQPVGRQDAASAFLLRALEHGPRPSGDLEDMATAEGLAWRTVRRAKQELGVSHFRRGKQWFWGLKSGGQ